MLDWERIDKSLLAEKIKTLRFGKGWSQKELAEKVDVSVDTIKRLENMSDSDNYTPSQSTVIKVFQVLGITPEELERVTLKREEEKLKQVSLIAVTRNDVKKFVLFGSALGFWLIVFLWLATGISDRFEQATPYETREQIVNAGISGEAQEVVNALRRNLDYELEVYKNPEDFDEAQLGKYWIPEEEDGRAIKKVRTAVARLKKYGLRYGSESIYEKLVFDSVKVSPSGRYADVQTAEIWYFPVYNSQGERTAMTSRFEDLRYVYTLKKLNGKWLLFSTTTEYYDDKL